MASVTNALQTALAHHQAGRLREAETLYRQVLAADPRQADAWHLLGLIALQVGQLGPAESCLVKAISLTGDRAVFHSNLGNVLRSAGQNARAEQALRRAIELDPTLAEAYNNLGNVLVDREDLEDAAAAYQRAIDLQPDFADPHNNLGTLLHRRGQLDEAIAHYRRALAVNPHYFDAYNNLGTALKLQERLDESADAYQSALRIQPQSASAHLNLGTVRQSQKRLDEAINCYREALRIEPNLALAHNNLGAVLVEQGKRDEARIALERALQLSPNLADAHYNLGTLLEADGDTAGAAQAYRRTIECDAKFAKALTALSLISQRADEPDQALKYAEQAVAADPKFALAYLRRAAVYELVSRPAEAVADYRRAIELKPNLSEAYNNLAMIYADRGQPDEAERLCRQGLTFDADAPALHANLATALTREGRQTEAVATARRAVELQPESVDAHSNLLYALNYLPDLDPQAVFEEHLAWAQRHAEPLTAAAAPLIRDRDPARRLRVGYVSPYFRDHAVSFFSEPLITSHDHQQVELFLYSDNRRNDAISEKFRAAADHWRDVRKLSDAELADQIRADEIDVLVDLTGHIALHRLLVFARRPAPVQVTYIGYQNTTGMSAMDYRLTDQRADPPGTDRYYTETLYRLPHTYFCYRPSADVPKVVPPPALSNRYITFGSFNNFTKVTPQVVDTWLDILAQVPGSKLLVLANRGGYVEQHFHRKAREREIDPARIELFNRMPRAEYYQLIARADIALDPFPFNGHTTTCDQTWLGLPTVMLQGDTYVSRYASGVLAPVGLERNITRSTDEFIRRAAELAGDLEELERLRKEMRPRMAQSVLLDFTGFARDVEAAYREMWVAWCERGERQS